MQPPVFPRPANGDLAEGSKPEVPSASDGVDAMAGRLHDARSRHLRYLRSRLASLEDAEDALQDTALKLIRHADTLASIERPEARIGISLRHTVIDRYRRAAARRRLTEALLAEPREVEPEVDDEVMPIDCMRGALTGLKPEYGALLQQVYLEGVALKHVAQREGLTANNAAVRIHRARNALRQSMARGCETCSLDDCWVRKRLATWSIARDYVAEPVA